MKFSALHGDQLECDGSQGVRALECNLTGRCPFLKNLHNPFREKNCISIPCFGICRLQSNRENNSLLFVKTIAWTIAYCFWTNSHNPFRNFWSIFIPGSGNYAEKWYPEKRHVPYRFIWKCPPPPPRNEQVKLEEFNLKWYEIHGRIPHNVCTDTIIHKAAYSSCKTISPVVKQFHASNKSDHLQLRPELPLHSNFCVALTMRHRGIFVCCSLRLVLKSFLILGYM